VGPGPLTSSSRSTGPRASVIDPVYSHCDYLNTLADYGVVGFALFFGPVAYIGWRTSRASGLAAAAWTGLLAFFLHLLVDFHLKIPALAMIVATISALVVREAWPGGGGARRGRPVPLGPFPRRRWCAAVAVLVLAVFFVAPKYEAEKLRWAAREKDRQDGRIGSRPVEPEGRSHGGKRRARPGGFARSHERAGLVRPGQCVFALGPGRAPAHR
jgi:hypothetical protein